MDYISAREVADKWGISQRRVAVLCSENRVKDAKMVGNMWIIPDVAEKPEDARGTRFFEKDDKTARPFLKWAGGKSQLLSEIEKYYPFDGKTITKYVEPFVGGGAVLFDVLNKFELSEVYISDINADLINAYQVVKTDVETLITRLSKIQEAFLSLTGEERKSYYYFQRERHNALTITDGKENVEKATLMIFLNKTCFNGLYRVNRKGLFNVPMGAYKSPLICDEKNLRAVSDKLKNVKIVCGDYKDSAQIIDSHTFVYFDPPYRPLTKTSGFTAYTEESFSDEKQIELASFVETVSKKGAKIIVSNSDPKNINPNDDFFDNLYSHNKIVRVDASRMINSNSKARGKIKELIISN